MTSTNEQDEKSNKIQAMIQAQIIPGKTPTEFTQTKLRKDAARNWDIFYKHNTTNFFKDRHWTDREFAELRPTGTRPANSVTLLEIGCGVGNFVFPLLQSNTELFIYACDFSPRAIEFVNTSAQFNAERCRAFVCDVTSQRLTDTVPAESLDIVSAIFMLSAIPPEKMTAVVDNIASVVKPGGVVLFRDYGLHDVAQLRFKADNRLDDRFYARSDGTFAYYFSTKYVAELFGNAGFDVIENTYISKRVVNRKEGLEMDRIFVQARLRKRGADAPTLN